MSAFLSEYELLNLKYIMLACIEIIRVSVNKCHDALCPSLAFSLNPSTSATLTRLC